MFKKMLVWVAACCAASAFAAVDVNQASEAELDGIKGIGPSTTRLIMTERGKAEFSDWKDFIQRVKGMGHKNAVKYSADGLTVRGLPYGSTEKADSRAGQAGE